MSFIRTFIPVVILTASSLFARGQSAVPAELDSTGGQWFGNRSMVVQDKPDGTTDTLQVQYHEILQGDTIPDNSDINYYWDRDFKLRTLPEGTPVSNPGQLNFLKTTLPNQPTEIKKLPAAPANPPKNKPKPLDLSA